MAEPPFAGPAAGRYNEETAAQLFHGATALMAVLGLVLQIMATGESPAHAVAPAHIWWNFLGSASLHINALVFIVSLSLLMEPARGGGPVWRAVRVITLAGTLLLLLLQFTPFRGIPDFAALSPTAVFADRLLHYAVPIMVIVGWLIFGPRPRITPLRVLWSLVYPAAWLLGVFIRGAATGWYPYPLLDVGLAGIGPVLVNCVMVLLLWLGAGFVFLTLDLAMGREPDGYLPGFGDDSRAEVDDRNL
jgi:hypothetical protein